MHTCATCMNLQRYDSPKSSMRLYWSSTPQSASSDGEARGVLSLLGSNALISESTLTSDSVGTFNHIDSEEAVALHVKESPPPRPTFVSFLAAMDAQRYDLSLASNHSLPPIHIEASPAPRQHDHSASSISSIVFADPQPRALLPSYEEDNGVQETFTTPADENDGTDITEGWTVSYVIAPLVPTASGMDDVGECASGCVTAPRSLDLATDDCLPIYLNPVFNSSVFSLDGLNCIGSTDSLDETRRERIINDLIAKKEKELAGEPPIRIWVTQTTDVRVEETWRDPVREILYGRFAGGEERISATVSRD